MNSPTQETYTSLAKAFAHFNRALFGNELPGCIITLNRTRNAKGYFWGDTWYHSADESKADEISLNPDTLKTRTTEEVLSTLVHEMCHLKQHHFGKPSRNGYHNKQWAGMMLRVGLVPTDTGAEGGKITGQNVTHYIERSGKFQRSCYKLTDAGFIIPWLANTGGQGGKKKKAKGTPKTKYTCEGCGLNVWGRNDLNIACLDCKEALIAD